MWPKRQRVEFLLRVLAGLGAIVILFGVMVRTAEDTPGTLTMLAMLYPFIRCTRRAVLGRW